jgi:hygromycin-B 4-O-kinase
MAQKPDISAQDTLQFLHDKLNDDIAHLTLLSGGEWSQAYSFVHQHQKYVLRWCHSSETFEKDAAASRFSSAAMPVPSIIDAGAQFDTYFAITEFAQGKFIEALTSSELDNTLPALFSLFDALRNTDLANTTGYGGWDKDGIGDHKSWKEFLLAVKGDRDENSTEGWYADLANSSVGTQVFNQVYAQLEALVEKCPEERALIHSDLLHSNLLVSDARMSAVIDWQCSLYGDSFYDVAWFIYYAPWFPQFEAVQLRQKLLAHFEASKANHANLDARLRCYQLHIGLGSIAYNSFKKDWKTVQEDVEYVLRISRQAIP